MIPIFALRAAGRSRPFTFLRLRALTATVLVLLSSTACQADRGRVVPGARSADEVVSVSFPPIGLEENERIVGLEIAVTHGFVTSIDNIPPDWDIHLEVDPPWQTKVSGATHHGTGALTSPSPLDSLVTIRPWPDKNYGLDIQATLHTTIDFEKTRTREFKMNELELRKRSR